VDSLEIRQDIPLFLHRYARPAKTIPTYRLHWQYLTWPGRLPRTL